MADVLGSRIKHREPLSGGCVSTVMKAKLADGRIVVAKIAGEVADPRGALGTEASMLQALAEDGWPVPGVLHVDDDLLLLEFVPNDGQRSVVTEQQAAALLAARHAIVKPAFGFTRDTVIAGLPQTNPRSADWIPFFAEHRLLAMARQAQVAQQLSGSAVQRIEILAGRLDRWLLEPEHPSLIHGDLWGGNVLFHEGRVASFIDPACYWAHAEVELAFTTLFQTFDEAFYRRYAELRPIPDGFYEERRDLYNLYPLLVHVRLFGGTYLSSVEATLNRFGV
ncbi:MAG: fructosamine kinase family protein [Pseudomonadota bacterium]